MIRSLLAPVLFGALASSSVGPQPDTVDAAFAAVDATGGPPPPTSLDASDASGEHDPADAGKPLDAVPAEAAVDAAGAPAHAFQNSLGMKFAPTPIMGVLFSIWETRLQDYEAYAQATGAPIPRPDFVETALQPKAAVSRAEAQAFAAWLTAKEQKEGGIATTQKYRLPTDAEWDVAFGVGMTGTLYPWGSPFPPPDHFANYGITNDSFVFTAPVGSFAPNPLGLYDMAGNVWEWIGEGCATGGAYLVRGAGWNAKSAPYMESAFHYCFGADLVGHHNVGFRVVLDGARK
jgi:hypothetical protein